MNRSGDVNSYFVDNLSICLNLETAFSHVNNNGCHIYLLTVPSVESAKNLPEEIHLFELEYYFFLKYKIDSTIHLVRCSGRV